MTPAEVLLGSAIRSGAGWQWRRNQEKRHSKYKTSHRQNPTDFYVSLHGWSPRNTFSPLFTASCGRTTLSLHERCLTFHMFGRGTNAHNDWMVWSLTWKRYKRTLCDITKSWGLQDRVFQDILCQGFADSLEPRYYKENNGKVFFFCHSQ